MLFRIKEARKKANLTQKELAEKLGIKVSTLSGYEIGAHDPKSNTLTEIARICNTTTDFLLGRDWPDPQKETPADVGGLDGREERFVWLYRQLGDDGVRIIEYYLSLSPSNRRLMLAIVQAILQEQDKQTSPVQ